MAAKRKGRPPIDPRGGPSCNLNLRVSVDDYDALYTKACQDRISVPEFLRKVLRAAIRQDPPKP